jgi:putative ABC transport system permease protein
MQFRETMKMALASLGANKLRAALTMAGITIGVFSIISVMTAIGALQSSIESGISFLGSNVFQFAKYPVNIDAGGNVKKKYQNRRNVTYKQALRYAELMRGEAQEVCLKCFGRDI